MAAPRIRIPKKHLEPAKSFCRSLSSCPPVYVEHKPLLNKPFGECFAVVEEHVQTHGGCQQLGWMISEVTGVWLEAEFHAVWQREDGALINLAPLPSELTKILFVPDPKQEYRGVAVPNRYRALSSKPAVQLVIRHTEAFGRIRQEYDLATEQGRVADIAELEARLLHTEEQMRQAIRALIA